MNKQFLIDYFKVTDYDDVIGKLWCDISIHDQLITWLQLYSKCDHKYACQSRWLQYSENYVFLCDVHYFMINKIWG